MGSYRSYPAKERASEFRVLRPCALQFRAGRTLQGLTAKANEKAKMLDGSFTTADEIVHMVVASSMMTKASNHYILDLRPNSKLRHLHKPFLSQPWLQIANKSHSRIA